MSGPGRSGLIARAATWYALAGGVVLLALVLFSVADSVLRYWFDSPIRGSTDITQVLLALIVASSIAYGGVSGAHVALDLLGDPASGPISRAIAIVVHVLGIGILAVLAWRCAANGLSAAEYGESSQLLRFPYLPFYFALAIGVAGYAAVLGVDLLRLIRLGESRAPGE